MNRSNCFLTFIHLRMEEHKQALPGDGSAHPKGSWAMAAGMTCTMHTHIHSLHWRTGNCCNMPRVLPFSSTQCPCCRLFLSSAPVWHRVTLSQGNGTGGTGLRVVGGCFLLPLQHLGRYEHASIPPLTNKVTWHGERSRENIQVPIPKISKHAAATVDDLGELTCPVGRNLTYLVQSQWAQHQKNQDWNVKFLQCWIFLVFFI